MTGGDSPLFLIFAASSRRSDYPVSGRMYHQGKQARIGLRLPVSGPENPAKPSGSGM